MKTKIRYAIITVLLVGFFLIIRSMNRHNESFSFAISDPSSCQIRGDKWIVTTVTSLDIETIRQILSIPQWNILAIGDKKTPSNWFQQFSSQKLLYLSFQQQLRINLRSTRYISYGINAQKNIAYLVATFCGAKIIYELNDNNLIWDSAIQLYPNVLSSKDIPWLAFHLRRSPLVNIYGIFGQPKLWPRGFPLNELQNISEDGWSSLRRNDNETINPYIQQQLLDFDPDVDAVAQLTHRASINRMTFDHDRGPVALEPFTFSPYNCHNTIHYLHAFWGLYLPVTIPPNMADIWRSFWVQRLLWDIGGHLLFTASTFNKYKRVLRPQKNSKDEQILYDEISNLVRFLNSWKHDAITLSDRIQELINALIEARFLNSLETKVIRAWLDDLYSIKYKYPLGNNVVKSFSAAPVRMKRAAICLTGLTECVQEVWAKNEMELRKRLNGEIDVFLFLSTGNGMTDKLSPVVSQLRTQQARFYNATVNIIRQDILDINPGFPPTCKYEYIFTEKHKIIPIEQERFAQATCYSIVRDYEKKRNIRYQLLMRTRSDAVFARLPKTFERSGKFNPNNNIIVPDEHHYYGLNDRFAIGPMASMKLYMSRWYELSHCFTKNVHPESFLAFVLRRNNVKVTKDIDISLVQIPHSQKQCH